MKYEYRKAIGLHPYKKGVYRRGKGAIHGPYQVLSVEGHWRVSGFSATTIQSMTREISEKEMDELFLELI